MKMALYYTRIPHTIMPLFFFLFATVGIKQYHKILEWGEQQQFLEDDLMGLFDLTVLVALYGCIILFLHVVERILEQCDSNSNSECDVVKVKVK